MTRKLTMILTAITIGGLYAGSALADEKPGVAEEVHDEEFSFGEAGKASEVTRTIEVEMTDNAFNHRVLDVKPGETIRFNVHNKGEVVHEFNIAMASMQAEHQEQMMQMMESGVLDVDRINYGMMGKGGMMSGGAMMGQGAMMEGGAMLHNDPNSVLLEPGKSAELIWRFKKAENVEFACNVPGHYESGMKGPIMFQN